MLLGFAIRPKNNLEINRKIKNILEVLSTLFWYSLLLIVLKCISFNFVLIFNEILKFQCLLLWILDPNLKIQLKCDKYRGELVWYVK